MILCKSVSSEVESCSGLNLNATCLSLWITNCTKPLQRLQTPSNIMIFVSFGLLASRKIRWGRTNRINRLPRRPVKINRSLKGRLTASFNHQLTPYIPTSNVTIPIIFFLFFVQSSKAFCALAVSINGIQNSRYIGINVSKPIFIIRRTKPWKNSARRV